VPDVEDVNRDKSMNTVNSYFEYEIPITPSTMNAVANEYVTDFKELDVVAPNGETIPTEWVQFKIPISEPDRAVNGITDYRSIRFMRMYMAGFEQETTLRFGTMELVRGDYRRYTETLDATGEDPDLDDTVYEVEAVNIQENENRLPIPYRLPPGVVREELNNNNNIIRQNEQSLAMRACGLEPDDGRSVYKNFQVDMRQYENLEMFIHAESIADEVPLADGEMVAFIRLGNDLSENFYEIQVPLNPTMFGTTSDEEIWPEANRLNLRLSLLQAIKSLVLDPDTPLPAATSDGVVFYNESELGDGDIAGENELRIGIKGNPSFGNVRIIMLGLKNASDMDICGEVWFNELRLSELKNQGGWAAVASLDANLADFANVSATANKSTIGFGSVDQSPNARSREDAEGYDMVTNLNLGQMLPNNWGIQLPFNYGRSVETITPQYDPEFQDIELESRLDNTASAEERDRILEQSIDYTKRQSVNLIGVRKERSGDGAPNVYDIENFTFSGSYNQLDHHDFEVEEAFEQVVRAGATYNYNFNAKTIEPFKKNDSLFTSKYLQFLKDINLNYLPSNINVGSNITRKYNEQKFREINLVEGNLPAPKLYQRNYLFDWNYGVNWNLTKSLRFNFTATNNRIVNNYIDEDGVVDNSIGVWDGFFDIGDPNLHQQQLELNYELPFDKLAFLKFIRATYSYTGNFQWQGGSDLFNDIDIALSDGTTNTYNLGNSVQNSSAHRINTNLDFNSLYRSVGLTKKRATSSRNSSTQKGGNTKGGKNVLSVGKESASGRDAQGSGLSAGDKAANTLIGLATMIKKVQLNYTQNEGTYLPGYTPTIGLAGTLKPTTGFTLGSQRDVREEAARKGWLTLYPEFNEQYTETDTRQLDIQANLEPLNDLKIDLNANRTYSENYTENYIVTDNLYNSLTPNTSGNFNISTFLLKTAFGKSDENGSAPFDEFRSNRKIIAERLATDFYGGDGFATDDDGYPVGFGKTSQDVLLPAFLAAYKGSDASSEDTGFLRGVPLPNWDIKYTGLMKLDWFKKNFKRFSLQHGYQAGYTVNQFQTNLDYNRQDPTETDQAGNFKSEYFLTNVNLTEQFSPLIRVDFEMKNSVKILAELRKDRALGLSFANNLLTEIVGNEVTLGLGYRLKDLRIATNFGGKKQILKSDLNFKLDGSVRNNKTIIRYLDLNNNQITAGQTIYGLQFSADYALSKNLTALFYYDHTFSEYAISTAFPQTTIRSGLTLRYNFGN
jgi:cell surface protein SprA